MSIKVGFVGYARSGKDTAYSVFKELGSDAGRITAVHRVAFADPLKDLCDQWILQTYPDAFYRNGEHTGYNPRSDDHKERQIPTALPGLTPRKVYQHIGTEGYRFLDPDCWARIGVKTADSYSSQTMVCSTDVRFLNEARVWREAGGLLVRIRRPDTDPKVVGRVAKILGWLPISSNVGIVGHASEAEIHRIPCDYEVVNDGTLDDLWSKLAEVFHDVCYRKLSTT